MKKNISKKSGQTAKKWLLAIALAIVFTMFVSYGIRTFTREPQYDNYCNYSNRALLVLNTSEECIKNGGQWTENTQYAEKYASVTPAMTGYCDPDFNCRQDYDKARTKYEDSAFIVMIVSGFLGIVLGIILSIQSLSLGFLLGGILNLFIGTVSYWGRFQTTIKFVIIGAIMLLLIWLGWKKLK